MSHRWLLSLLCLAVLVPSVVQLTRARGELRVNEARTRILLQYEPAEVQLALENSSGESFNVGVQMELLDPNNNVHSQVKAVRSVAAGSQTLKLSLPFSLSKLNDRDRSQLLWYRLHYRLTEDGSPSNVIADGIISLSEIAPDLFDVRVVTSELAREGHRYRARVQTAHPITRKPAVNVRIDGEITLDQDNDRSVKLRASKMTDGRGYALLDFVLPPRFPQFPRNLQPSGGEIHVVARNGALMAETKGDVLVDQSVRTLISTDKPIYQPGQVMHVRALMFTPSKQALANQNILIRISDPDGTTIYRTIARSSRFGVVNTDWPIPENTRLGDYRIWVGVDGGEESDAITYEVRISRYDLPNFAVTVERDRDYYLPGQNAEVRVRADYIFGHPVPRGHVRVVRESQREWNYREQKWDIEEGEKYEGETGAAGVFVARINLADDYKDLGDEDYSRFKDLSYAAYFTDPTTNRTEQRRFDLRVSKEAIHVYVIQDYSSGHDPELPLKFYVSASYADGSPALCEVNVKVSRDSDPGPATKLVTLRTNRYGLAKASGVRLPRELKNESKLDLIVSAVDSRRRRGTKKENVSIDRDDTVRVETDKTLYRAGEPITALITSSLPDEALVVDLARDSRVIQSQRVQLRNGRATVNFAYKPEFINKLTIAAYPDFSESQRQIGMHAVLYPRDPELKVNVRTSQASYRPGEEARINLSVRAAEGAPAESALGVVVLDKAVGERSRTDNEFGHRSYNSSESLQRFLGLDQQLAGVTLRDLQRTDTSKGVLRDLDLLAEVLLNQSRDYQPEFHGGDQYETDQAGVFGVLIRDQLKVIVQIFTDLYTRTAEYPKDNNSLKRLLLELKVDLDALRDPWGMPYRVVFSVHKQFDVIELVSNGADKRSGTDDDFPVKLLSRPYFRPTGETIDRALRRYHERTGSYIRDRATLRAELLKDNLDLDQMVDRWNQPYRFEFDIHQSNYVIRIKSGGVDRHFSSDARDYEDDFTIWTSSIDYFAERRERIQAALTENLKLTKRFPQSDQALREALRNTDNAIESLRDPWNRPYYAIFKTEAVYADRVRIENRGNVGQPATLRTEITPVTQMVAFVSLRSSGPDGAPGTIDDFAVATFHGVLSEQQRGETQPHAMSSPVVLSETSGAIIGVVTDSQGAGIPGTTITATRSDAGQTYRTSSNDEGKYGFAQLPPGVYEIRFEAPGFVTHVFTDVMVRASSITEVNAALEVGTVTETVTVTAAAPALSQTQSAVSGRRLMELRPGVVAVSKSGSQQLSTPRLREYFPETLVWQPSIETDKRGRAQLNFKLADNITTWKLAVIGSTEDGRIGATETEIKAFQPFFVEHDPPRVLTQGDEISLPVVVRNYLERAQQIDLEIKAENWFSLLGPARKRSAVAAGDATRETFDFRAINSVSDGKQRITALARDANDAIEKPITVHPDGEEVSVTAGDILGVSAALELELPETTIPDSQHAELKIYPNLMTHVVESVEAVMARPYGCGEQTISSSYPSLFLLRHHKRSGGEFPLRARAQRYLDDGYSRLLNYRDSSGGFTYWGRGDADVALTAYALRFLTDADELISVDQKVIDEAREWLIKQQRPEGNWGAQDSWTSTPANRRNALLTAYVTRVLAITEAKLSRENSLPKVSAALKRALDYLAGQVNEIDEPYLLASYALAAIEVGDVSRAKPVVEKLRSLALAEGGMTYWSLETNTPFYGWGRAGRVETTALVVQALTRDCNSRTASCDSDPLINRALLFLLKQKDRYGVWYSTQATINVLDAMLTLFFRNPALKTNSAAADILINGRVVQTIQIPVADRLSNPITLDIARFLHTGKNSVQIRRASGLPFASVQALLNYYVPWPTANVTNDPAKRSGSLRLVAKFDKTEGRINDEIVCHVEAERVGFSGYGMMLAEIGLPPGAEVDRSSLEKTMKSSGWGVTQYDVLPDRLVVYLWPRAGGVKFDFKFRPRFGLKAKTAPSIVYDYYNPEARATVPPSMFTVK